jgi:hypothetical protein
LRKIFEGQLPLDGAASEAVMDEAFVVLDTNALLDLYRYSKDASAEFLSILESLGDDLWMPHHVGWEFLRRRATLRASATEKHDQRLQALAALKKALEKTGGHQSHVGGDVDETTFERALTSYTDRLKHHRKAIASWATSATDELLEQILDLYEGKTGQAPSEAWYAEQQRIGKARYEQGIPPGYMDGSKQSNRYGDFYIWWQCIERAKALQKPLVFVTNDGKEDWWEQIGGKGKSPHTELLQEFWNETGQRFILMDPLSFYDEFRPEPTGDEEANFSTRDEIVATQASVQKRSLSYPIRLSDSVWNTSISELLANHPPKYEFDYAEAVRTILKRPLYTQLDYSVPGRSDDDDGNYEVFVDYGDEEIDEEVEPELDDTDSDDQQNDGPASGEQNREDD